MLRNPQVAPVAAAEVKVGRLFEGRRDALEELAARVEHVDRAAAPIGCQQVAVRVEVDAVRAAVVVAGKRGPAALVRENRG
jgi:hypothetical protein